MRCSSESFSKCAFLFVFCLWVSSDSSVGCLESLPSILLVCVLYIRVVLISSVRAFCVSFQFLSLLFFLRSRRLQYSLCCPLFFLHLFPSFQLSLVNLSCLLCVVSFSFIPRLLRYSLRLRACSRNFSGELCSALLSPSFRTFVGPVFSNIAPSTLLSSISYYNKPQHLFKSFTVFKIYLYTMGYVFSVGVRDHAPAYFSFLTFHNSCSLFSPSQIFYLYLFRVISPIVQICSNSG